MPITTIDSTSALVVIDMQKGIVSSNTVHPAKIVIANVVRLAEAFREKKRKVVLVHVGWAGDGGDSVQYIDELRADPAVDILIQKRQWGAFYGTDLDLQLRRRGVTNIVLCGISTSIGVESTARDAWERSYNLTFVSDAMTDMNADAHDRALQIIFPRIGEIGTTEQVIEKL